MDNIGGIPSIGWLVIAFIAVLIFIVLVMVIRRGVKAGIAGQTIEIAGPDGEKQQTDHFGLMYIMNDNCHQIEQRKKERIDSIIPELSYRLNAISATACLNLKAESILQTRRRRNGFENLKTEKFFRDYVNDIIGEMSGKLRSEFEKVKTCSIQPVQDIDNEAIQTVAELFVIRAIKVCVEEYREKAEMYRRFEPLFSVLKDQSRVDFCKQKIKKHEDRIKGFNELLSRIEG